MPWVKAKMEKRNYLAYVTSVKSISLRLWRPNKMKKSQRTGFNFYLSSHGNAYPFS